MGKLKFKLVDKIHSACSCDDKCEQKRIVDYLYFTCIDSRKLQVFVNVSIILTSDNYIHRWMKSSGP